MSPAVSVATQPIYGLPRAYPLLSKFQQALLAFDLSAYYPLGNIAAGACKEYYERDSMVVTGGVTVGSKLAPGGSNCIICSPGQFVRSASVFPVPSSAFTIGVIAEVTGVGASGISIFGCYDYGQMIYSYPLGTSLFFMAHSVNLSSGARSGAGRHFWVVTYDGTTTTMYLDGTYLTSGSIGAPSGTSHGWGINIYDDEAVRSTGTMKASDAFILSSCLSAPQVARLQVLAFGR